MTPTRATAAVIVCLVAVSGLFAVGCSGRSSPPRIAASGTLKGTLETVGGAHPGTARPISGIVYLRPIQGTAVTVAVGSDGAFSAQVAVGSYTVTGSSPQYEINGADAPCGLSPPSTVSVAANQAVSVSVECVEK
jgi:hypothetical protein